MRMRRAAQFGIWRIGLSCACIAAIFTGAPPSIAQQDGKNPSAGVVTLDRAVAVVNRQVILESDLEDELQMSVLDPTTNPQEQDTERQALERLISRTLIDQQMREEDVQSVEPKPEEIAARLHDIRTKLPACVRADCKSDDGWKRFLAQHDLTAERVTIYLRNRMRILSFIELRFRQGIRITPEEIEAYYREQLLPQYPSGATVPPLDQVSSRIEDILLEQHVNLLFDTWLSNLRKQGQIEVLDPALETNDSGGSQGATKE